MQTGVSKVFLLSLCAILLFQAAAMDKKEFFKDFVKVSTEFEATIRDVKSDFKSRALSHSHAEKLSKILRGVKETILHIPQSLFDDPFVHHALKRVRKVADNVVGYFALDAINTEKLREVAVTVKQVSTDVLKTVLQELLGLYAAITERISFEDIDEIIKTYVKAVRENNPREFLSMHYHKLFRDEKHSDGEHKSEL